MSSFEKHRFTTDEKHGLIGSFIESSSMRNDSHVEISFAQLEPGFTAAPHIHTQTKTLVIVLKGGMTFTLDGEMIDVNEGEYIVFAKGVVEEVVSVKHGTQNLTVHTPSIPGGDKKAI